MTRPRSCDYDVLKSLCDGVRTVEQIAATLGVKHKTIENLVLKLNLPRRKLGQRGLGRKRSGIDAQTNLKL